MRPENIDQLVLDFSHPYSIVQLCSSSTERRHQLWCHGPPGYELYDCHWCISGAWIYCHCQEHVSAAHTPPSRHRWFACTTSAQTNVPSTNFRLSRSTHHDKSLIWSSTPHYNIYCYLEDSNIGCEGHPLVIKGKKSWYRRCGWILDTRWFPFREQRYPPERPTPKSIT